jgi:hypothetical protein
LRVEGEMTKTETLKLAMRIVARVLVGHAKQEDEIVTVSGVAKMLDRGANGPAFEEPPKPKPKRHYRKRTPKVPEAAPEGNGTEGA